MFIRSILAAITIIASSNIYALDHTKELKERITSLKADIPIEHLQGEVDFIKKTFNNINLDTSINKYKKYLIKRNYLVYINSIYISDNEEKLTSLAKESFPLSVCFSYQFQSDTSRRLNHILSQSLYTDDRIKKYNKSAIFLYSDSMMKKLEMFFPKKISALEKNCSGL